MHLAKERGDKSTYSDVTIDLNESGSVTIRASRYSHLKDYMSPIEIMRLLPGSCAGCLAPSTRFATRPASITATIGPATHWTTGTYSWDGTGNVKGIGDSRFVYGLVNRLTLGRVSTNAMGSGSVLQQGYTYDAFGNIQSITGSPGRATPTSSATNRLQGTAEYSAAGNLTSWNGNVYEYDAFHMMTRMIAGAENWLYVYTVDDERIWQFRMSAESATHRYTLRDLGGQVLREYTVGGDFWTVERDYVYRGGLLLAAETPEGERHFHLDHLGTPRLITGANGGRVAYHVYFPFGEEATDPFQDGERMKFTGHERDLADPSGTGDDLDYMHARFCSPLTGRFTSMDPATESFSPGAPQTWNRYSYVLNNPLNAVDPDGEIGFVVAVAIGIAVGGVLFGPSAANAPESADTELIPSTHLPLDVMAAEAVAGPAGGLFSRFFGKVAGFFKRTPKRGPPNPGGRLGSPKTRTQVEEVATEMKNRGFEITHGGGRGPEEFIRGAGPGTKGSAFPDITATKNGRTLRVNTVDTLKDGVTPTAREARNAARIRELRSKDHLLLIPKQ